MEWIQKAVSAESLNGSPCIPSSTLPGGPQATVERALSRQAAPSFLASSLVGADARACAFTGVRARVGARARALMLVLVAGVGAGGGVLGWG